MRRYSLSFALFVTAAARVVAGPADVAVLFTNAAVTTGSSTSVFVVGSIPQLGNWDASRATKMIASNCVGQTCDWSITIGIPEGMSYEYKFIQRQSDCASCYSNPANAAWEPPPNRTGSTPAGPPAPYQGKTVFYYSSWPSVTMLYSNTTIGWTTQPMTAIGPGRSGGEQIWRVDGINRAGDPNLSFAFTDNQGHYDIPPADSGGGCYGRVCVSPVPPVAGNTATITYTPAGGPLAGAASVCIHLGWNNWSTVVSPDAAMTAVSNTWVYSVTVPGNATQLDCVFNNCAGTWDNNSTLDWHFGVSGNGTPLNYETPLDACVVQDKQIYNYWPPATVSPSRVLYIPSNASFAPTNGLAARAIRVYLPRGYDQNTTKRYPVLYMHDGQNVFIAQYAGAFGCWYADTNANNLIRFSKMRETIIVGVDNSSDRGCEYEPPDCSNGCPTPRGDKYVSWIIDRIKTFIDQNYRTLTDADNTGVLGSSYGALISNYMGLQFSGTFHKIGMMSYPPCIPSPDAKRPIRIYLDSGDSVAPNYDGVLGVIADRDNLIKNGYVLNEDFDHTIGYGDQHNEAAWSRRSPRCFTFLFPTSDDPNTVLDTAAPPRITNYQLAGGSNVLTWTSYRLRTYTVQGITNESLPASITWSNVFTTPVSEPRFWSYPSLGVTNNFHFLRVRENTVPNWPN